jgi:dTDP-glucose 4,6-dehydratase
VDTIVVTGGAGFIGANFVRHALAHTDARVMVLDKLTYAGNLESLADVSSSSRYAFVQADIADREAVRAVFAEHRPAAVVNFAAETHVDRSIDDPGSFVRTNVTGAFELLEAARLHLREHPSDAFRFLHVSTDEVYGTLAFDEAPFTETRPFAPNSPYAASKAAADHLVRAYHHTYGLEVTTSNCSNNYGPFHFPEKLIPLIILNALERNALPVYGDGSNVRDWLFVEDHARALGVILAKGVSGETYNVGGRNERKNIEVVKQICSWMDQLRPANSSYHDLISFVTDRPGHDRRYAIELDVRGAAHTSFSLRQHGTCYLICVSFLCSASAKTKHKRKIKYRCER